MIRTCTTCGLQNRPRTEARFVATAPSKMQWYECGKHGPEEHAATLGEQGDRMAIRCSLVPLHTWLEQIGLPCDRHDDFAAWTAYIEQQACGKPLECGACECMGDTEGPDTCPA